MIRPMPIVREYAMQSIFAAAQSVVIVAGSMFTATVLKVRGFPEARSEWPMLAVFVREWGFTLMLIPAAWVLGTIWLERHRADWFTKRWTILSGVILVAALCGLMAYATVSADNAQATRSGRDPRNSGSGLPLRNSLSLASRHGSGG